MQLFALGHIPAHDTEITYLRISNVFWSQIGMKRLKIHVKKSSVGVTEAIQMVG